MLRQLVVDIDIEARNLARLIESHPAPVVAAPGGPLEVADAVETSGGQFDMMTRCVRASIRRVARAHHDADEVMIAWTLAVRMCDHLNKTRESSLS